MRYLLDTNICIYLIKRQPEEVLKRFREKAVGDVAVSTITIAELQFGVEKSTQKSRNQAALHNFLGPLEIAAFDYEAAAKYGSIRADLEKQGRLIGPYDLMIAAHALALGCKLVTNNEKEFDRVDDLEIENWAK